MMRWRLSPDAALPFWSFIQRRKGKEGEQFIIIIDANMLFANPYLRVVENLHTKYKILCITSTPALAPAPSASPSFSLVIIHKSFTLLIALSILLDQHFFSSTSLRHRLIIKQHRISFRIIDCTAKQGNPLHFSSVSLTPRSMQSKLCQLYYLLSSVDAFVFFFLIFCLF